MCMYSRCYSAACMQPHLNRGGGRCVVFFYYYAEFTMHGFVSHAVSQ